MKIELREFQASDLEQLDRWAKAIGSTQYMSRYRPRDPSWQGHQPEQGLFWFVIVVSGRDGGTVWLEPGAQPDEAVLGILIGKKSLLGQRIGETAITLALKRVAEAHRYRSVTLNVRATNQRAIACYQKCGFLPVASGTKRTDSGDEIAYITMQRYLKEGKPLS
ncbi:MAG: GNAT family protein [Anaerolineae bacterium]|jgi:RimJ/RimL family protein N-acetyltransferase|nr:GNAT family protein [Anaerolineae bacterium]